MLLGAGEPPGENAAPPDALLTVREAAAALRVRPVTVYKLCSNGALPHVRVSNAIRIPQRALAAFIQNGGT